MTDSEMTEYRGELLEVGPAYVVVLHERTHLVRIQTGVVTRLRAPDWSGRRSWDPEDRGEREELRLLSRYPQGMSASLIDRLLEVYGGEFIDVRAPDRRH